MSLYVVLCYYRSRLLASPTEIRVMGVFRDRTFALAAVKRARWKHLTVHGVLTVNTPSGRVSISFGDYARSFELRQLLRASIARDVQKNYYELGPEINKPWPLPPG